jgi:hypothetical protein
MNLNVSNQRGSILPMFQPSCDVVWKGTTLFLYESADPQAYDDPSSPGKFSAIC